MDVELIQHFIAQGNVSSYMQEQGLQSVFAQGLNKDLQFSFTVVIIPREEDNFIAMRDV